MAKSLGVRQDKTGRWRDDNGHYASTPLPKLSASGRYRYPNGKYVAKSDLSPAQKAAQTRRVREYAAQLEAERKAAARAEARRQSEAARKPQPKPTKKRAVTIYEAGDKEGHAKETQDAAFDTIKFLHGSKGAPRSSQMKRARRSRDKAESMLAPYLGKTVTVKLRLRVYDEGMLKSRVKTVSRTFLYTQYKDFLDAVTDSVKTSTVRPGRHVIPTAKGSARAVFSGDIAIVLPDGKRKRQLRTTGANAKGKQGRKKKMGSRRKAVQPRAKQRRNSKKSRRIR